MRLLVIEDNPAAARSLEQGLASQGYSVDLAPTGHRGEELARIEPYDTIILDLMLPDHDGLCLCRNLRRQRIRTPVLMLTALNGTRNKVQGLDAGADDYLTKPFAFDELLARVRALLRRPIHMTDTHLQYADLRMDLLRRTVTRDGRPVTLRRKEFALLEYFMRNPDRLLSRTVIGEHVWDLNFGPTSNVIDVCVSALRRKIDKPFNRPLIHTIIGSGYLFGEEGAESNEQ